MPSPPELGNVSGEVRGVEVPHQVDAEESCRAYGYVGISGEVAVDLYGEEQSAEQQCQSAFLCVVVPYGVHGHGAVVCHHHFLEEAP